jgi:hypothetical protein
MDSGSSPSILDAMPLTQLSIVRSPAYAALLLFAPMALHAQRASPCGDSDKRASLRVHLEQLMRSNDPQTVYVRRDSRLPLVHPDSIRYIDDERICERAARVYYRYRLGPRPLGAVSVARVGNIWVVYGEERIGEWTGLDIYNSDFELVASIAS